LHLLRPFYPSGRRERTEVESKPVWPRASRGQTFHPLRFNLWGQIIIFRHPLEGMPTLAIV
jgi:hypothetical protein